MLITIAAAILSTTTPTAVETPAPAPAPRIETAKANPRVCVVDRVTGSMIPLRVCKTLSDWRAQGIDPLAKR